MKTNKVELIGMYGSDITHAQSAWTSTSRDLTEEKIKRIPKLLKMLAEGSDGNPHGTPFEKSSLHFLVTTDLATHIQWLKHRHCSVNTESARYKELKDDEKYYLPQDWPIEWSKKLQDYTKLGIQLYHECLEGLLAHGLDKKRAKESARYFRTYNTQITMDVMFNFRSFVHFQKLRNASGAQKEIAKLAQDMLELVKKDGRFKHSLKAWGL